MTYMNDYMNVIDRGTEFVFSIVCHSNKF